MAACSGVYGNAEQACLTAYYNGMKSMGINPPPDGTSHPIVTPPSGSASTKGPTHGFSWSPIIQDGALGAADQSLQTTQSYFLNDASRQGMCLREGGSNWLWKYSTSGKGTPNYFWAKGGGTKFANFGSKALPVAGWGLNIADDYNNEYAEEPSTGVRVSAAVADGSLTAAAGLGTGLAMAGFVSCPESFGFGCLIGLGALIVGASSGVALGTHKLVSTEIHSAIDPQASSGDSTPCSVLQACYAPQFMNPPSAPVG